MNKNTLKQNHLRSIFDILVQYWYLLILFVGLVASNEVYKATNRIDITFGIFFLSFLAFFMIASYKCSIDTRGNTDSKLIVHCQIPSTPFNDNRGIESEICDGDYDEMDFEGDDSPALTTDNLIGAYNSSPEGILDNK